MKKILSLIAFIAIGIANVAQAQDYNWPLTSNLSETITGLDGTNNGLTFANDATRGPVAEFDGETAYANIPSFLTGLEEVTISVWFRMDEIRPWSRIYSFGHGDQTEPKDVMMIIPVNGAGGDVDGFYRFTLSDPDGPWYDIDLDPETAPAGIGEWHSSTVVLKVDSIIIYHDDQLIFAEGGFTRHFGTIEDTENALGKSFWPDQLFKGAMSDLRVYKNALSSSEVVALYETTKNGTATAVNDINALKLKMYSINNRITISADGELTKEVVSVYNVYGALVAKESIENLNSHIFNSGVYIVNVKSEKVNYTSKVIVR